MGERGSEELMTGWWTSGGTDEGAGGARGGSEGARVRGYEGTRVRG
jgi:hypothetical protein